MSTEIGSKHPEGGPIESRQLAELIVETALEKKGFDPAILDVADLVGYADYFVLVSAQNTRQVRAIADEVRQKLKADYKLRPVGVEGTETNKWVLVDYDDVVLHVFLDGARAFYDLEGLWADAPRLPVPEAQSSAEEAPFFMLP
jgi:ribosome-associated protein